MSLSVSAGRSPAWICAAVIVVALAGCGAASTKPQAATASKPVGVAAESPQQILAAATAAAKNANAFHIVATSSTFKLDLELVRGKGGAGSFETGGNAFRVRRLGGTIYLQGSNAYYRKLGGPNAVQVLRGRWLKAPANSGEVAEFANYVDIDAMVKLIEEGTKSTGTLSKHTATVNGQPAVVITDSGSESVAVAATGRPYPLQLTAADGKVVVDRWDRPAQLTTPTKTIDSSKLTG
jgi:hypothetical protein